MSKTTLDEIFNMFEGGVHAKGSDKGGYPTYFTKPYPLWVEERKRAARQAILRWVADEVIGEDSDTYDWQKDVDVNGVKDDLRDEQRKILAQHGYKGGGGE